MFGHLAVAHQKNQKFIEGFGKNVVKIRKQKKITQEELAFRTGMGLSQIGRVERGEISTGLSVVFSIAEALEVKPKDLFNF
jgi:transcriptional regulator with XRE-family HTH domain